MEHICKEYFITNVYIIRFLIMIIDLLYMHIWCITIYVRMYVWYYVCHSKIVDNYLTSVQLLHLLAFRSLSSCHLW